MSFSTVVDWLDENSLRAYPLTSASSRFFTIGGVELDLYGIIVDANFVYSEHPISDIIKLVSLTWNNDSLEIIVKDLLPFSVTSVSSQVYPIYLRNANNDLLVLGEALTTILTATNDMYQFENIEFEPCIATEIRDRLSGINILSFNNSPVISDTVRLVEGYQTDIQFNGQVIEIVIGRNEGIPLSCQNFFQSELVYDCDTIVSFVNGASPRDSGGKISIKAGSHVKIYEDKEKRRIYIGLDFDSADVCKINTLPPV